MDKLDGEFLKNFMGFGRRKVKFRPWYRPAIDEWPVIAEGFFLFTVRRNGYALEPKKALKISAWWELKIHLW